VVLVGVVLLYASNAKTWSVRIGYTGPASVWSSISGWSSGVCSLECRHFLGAIHLLQRLLRMNADKQSDGIGRSEVFSTIFIPSHAVGSRDQTDHVQ
jgi:hypothetical protein